MYAYGIAVAVALALYLFLQGIDDRRADAKGVQRASLGKRIAIFGFLLAICLIVAHFAGSMIGGSAGGAASSGSVYGPGGVMKVQAMLKTIPEDVHVGLPEF